jgi:hypothetical protein
MKLKKNQGKNRHKEVENNTGHIKRRKGDEAGR